GDGPDRLACRPGPHRRQSRRPVSSLSRVVRFLVRAEPAGRTIPGEDSGLVAAGDGIGAPRPGPGPERPGQLGAAPGDRRPGPAGAYRGPDAPLRTRPGTRSPQPSGPGRDARPDR